MLRKTALIIVLYGALAGITWLYLQVPLGKINTALDIIARLVFMVLIFAIPGLVYGYESTASISREPDAGEGFKDRPNYPKSPKWEINPLDYHGSAAWDNPATIYERRDGRRLTTENSGAFYIGGGNAGNYIHSMMHAVTIAGSGQGKGVSIILPNLLSEPCCSWFVLDPKGENAKITARYQKEAGQNIVILDPWNEQKRLGATHGVEPVAFNPLDFVKGNKDELPENCSVIAAMLVPDQARVSDPFWNGRARALIKTYLMHLLTARPDDEHHLGTLYRWLRLPFQNRKNLWERIEENEDYDGIIQDSIGEFSVFGDDSKTLESIISTAQDCTTFLESAPLRKSLESNGFDPYELTNGKTTLYLCLPERFLTTHNRWLRLVVGVCLKACNYKPNKRINFLLDEFAILGKMQDVENAFAFARGQSICMWVFVQSLTQLIDIYGEHGANAFLANARLRQFFGVYDLNTQKYLSEYLGEETVKFTASSSSSSQGSSKTNSRGTNQGESTEFERGKTGVQSGSSEGVSEGRSASSSKSQTDQFITRRLLTSEEISKTKDIIILLDGQKYKLPRVPYWDDITKMYKEKRYTYYPINQQDWRRFIDEVEKRSPKTIAINFAELRRPDVPELKPGQKFSV